MQGGERAAEQSLDNGPFRQVTSPESARVAPLAAGKREKQLVQGSLCLRGTAGWAVDITRERRVHRLGDTTLVGSQGPH